MRNGSFSNYKFGLNLNFSFQYDNIGQVISDYIDVDFNNDSM